MADAIIQNTKPVDMEVPSWWREWQGMVNTRLGNLEHSTGEINIRLAVIESDQKAHLASVQAIRDYFDASLREMNMKLTQGVTMLQRTMDLHSDKLFQHEAVQARVHGGLQVLQVGLPLLYGIVGAVVSYWLVKK